MMILRPKEINWVASDCSYTWSILRDLTKNSCLAFLYWCLWGLNLWAIVWLPKECHLQEYFAFHFFSTLFVHFKFHGLLNFKAKHSLQLRYKFPLHEIYEINFSKNSDWGIFVILLCNLFVFTLWNKARLCFLLQLCC